MGHLSYASSTGRVSNAISIILGISLLIISCSAEYDVTYVNKNYFRISEFLRTRHLSYEGVCAYDSRNYTKGSEYRSNLLNVFSNLTAAAVTNPNMTFFNATAGSGRNRVYGSFYCRDPDVCSSCVKNCTNILKDVCPAKVAVLYAKTDLCQVSYSNISTFPENTYGETSILDCLDTMPRVPDPDIFNQTVVKSFQKDINQVVVVQASTNYTLSDHYARDFIPDLYMGQNVKTAVRCLPGISTQQCKDCLLPALDATVSYCLSLGKAWATIYRPNCRMQYNVLASLAPASSPAVLPLPQSPHSSPPTSASPGTARWSVFSLWIIATATIL